MLIYLALIESPEDQSKFEKLYIAYKKAMFNQAYSVLKNNQDAEDAVHDAFEYIAKNINNIDEPISKKAKVYVSIIAKNKAIDICRKKQRRQELPMEEFDGPVIDPTSSNGLAGCILQLPERDRQWILLRYYNGYSTKEVAKMMSLKESAAYQLDRRAKIRLEEICVKEGVLI